VSYLTNLFNESIAALKRRKNLIMLLTLAHIVFFILGQWMVAQKIPGALFLRTELYKMIQDMPFLKPLTGILADSLFLKIIYTLFVNLIFGAFLSTTLTGIVFFLPYTIAVWRSFVMGLLIYGLPLTPLKLVIFYVTLILEFGGYSISSATGTDIGLSLLWPLRKGTTSRKQSFLIAFQDSMRLYLLVFILLLIGAIWEMGWLHYLGPIVTHEMLKI
jgi:hypothetical protein